MKMHHICGGDSVQNNSASSVYIRQRMNLARHHLFAACRFAARVRKLEQEIAPPPSEHPWEEILQYSLGVATLSIAALESYANELCADGLHHAAEMNSVAATAIGELLDRERILEKFGLVLALRTGKKLETNENAVQNVDALIKLRNAVVHFRPEWFDEQNRHKKLSRQLSYKFSSSPFFSTEPLFPRAWASASFSSWAIESVVKFLDYFFAEAELSNPIDLFRTRLAEAFENSL